MVYMFLLSLDSLAESRGGPHLNEGVFAGGYGHGCSAAHRSCPQAGPLMFAAPGHLGS